MGRNKELENFKSTIRKANSRAKEAEGSSGEQQMRE